MINGLHVHVCLLHELDHKELRDVPGVYRLRHASHEFHVRTVDGQWIFSDLIKAGESLDLGGRLRQYKSASSEFPELNAFLQNHKNRMLVEYLFTGDPDDRVEHEARFILAHALDKGRLPRFNRIGEFSTSCKILGVCLSLERQKEIKRPWSNRAAPRRRL